jgi:hypothetical protein
MSMDIASIMILLISVKPKEERRCSHLNKAS